MRDIYIIGICGTGVGALAGMLKAQGHRVRGSDEHVYPPMSTKLHEWGIEVFTGYDEGHLTPAPELVIVGNVVRADNPEAVAVRQRQLPTLSMPQAVAEFAIGDKHSIVIAGTHGKTTTTALTAHVLLQAGRDPGYLVGGAFIQYAESCQAGTGEEFVIEGDEYDTAYFDKGSKFLHYRARTAVITSLEFDHADIFADLAAVEAAFAGLVRSVPPEGRIVVWQGATRARAVIAAHARTRDISVYSATAHDDADVTLAAFKTGPEGLTCEPVIRGRSLGAMRVPLWGEFSANNVLACLAALDGLGLSDAQLRAGLASFKGVRRRMEVRAVLRQVTVVDDFAHHPTAVAVTLTAARERWPRSRLLVAFEPRSATSRRNVFQAAYVDAFAVADHVFLASHPRLGEVPEALRFDPSAVVASLRERGVRADFIADIPALATALAAAAEAGDVILLLSNGDFAGLHERLEGALRT